MAAQMTTLFPPSVCVSVPPDVLIQDLEGEAVLLNIASGCYFGLDTTGYAMWLALVEAGSLEHAAARLMNEFDVTAGQLQQDLQDLLGNFY